MPCPVNGDAHPELLALEIKRTYDRKDKERFSVCCSICNTRVFLNNWQPSVRSRTIVMAEAEGLHPVGITEERRIELLRELGLSMARAPQSQPQPWLNQPPAPPYMPLPRTAKPNQKRRGKKNN